RDRVAEASLLYGLRGTDLDLDPVMLTAHLDVVPAEEDGGWPHPPFSGTVSEGRVWGRGAIDYKIGVSAMLEALEGLLARDFSPVRSLFLAFGHDEETGGDRGAAGIVALLDGRGVRLRSVLDEGGYIYSFPWLRRDVAVVGLAEKGYLTLRLTARGRQGHASVPGTATAAGNLCRALARLEDSQMEPRLCEPVRKMMEGTAHLIRDADGNVSANALMEIMSRYPSGNALVRTTAAITMISGSSKENIIPAAPHALVNLRAVPGDDSGSIIRHVRDIAGEMGVEVECEDTNHVHEPSAVSSAATPEYRAIEDAMEKVWPGIPVVPGIFPAATDSRHYCSIADDVYRFQPVHLGTDGLSALHSSGESVSVEDYMGSIRFYSEYIERICGA
ncbi:MAG: M20/M25/M40 family metallo-hydrolase, partial [Candidatus Fermentibacteraceae bacterium]|nr:M20/M25/M40 family metallo-hydrolase [Candidatus Fermentibacteraceae bacterium]